MQPSVVDISKGLPISSVLFCSKSASGKNLVTGDSADMSSFKETGLPWKQTPFSEVHFENQWLNHSKFSPCLASLLPRISLTYREVTELHQQQQ